MKGCNTIWLLGALLSFTSCARHYSLADVKHERIEVTDFWDVTPDSEAIRIVAPYKKSVDSLMSPVLGTSEVVMRPARPESLLSNFVADVLRDASAQIGAKADMGLCNVGGLRSTMPKGNVTYGDVLEISPFENHLCVVTLTGEHLLELMEQIAAVGGEGVSGVRLIITDNGELLSAEINGKPIDKSKKYTIATLDYLAEGNDKMYALKKSVDKRTTKLSVRQLIMDAIKRESAAGRSVTAKMEGRIVIK